MEFLQKKLGIAVNQLAQDLLSRKEGDRIPPISEYQERFDTSRGTIQNAIAYLKDQGALTLVNHGHMGSYIEQLDYRKLQECTVHKEILGAMPLPYSSCYQGLATALHQVFDPYAFNLVYARGAESRLRLLGSGICQFAVCSRYAAEEAIVAHRNLEIAVDLGHGTYLSRHVLVLRDPKARGITSGMRVAYDPASTDHRHITKLICRGISNVQMVRMHAHRIVQSIRDGSIDAGVWNLDEILESGYEDLNLVMLDHVEDVGQFSSAVLVVSKGENAMLDLIRQKVQPEQIRQIQKQVKSGAIPAEY